MKVDDLLLDSIVKLPKKQTDYNFRKYLFGILDEYLIKLKNLDYSGLTSVLPDQDVLRTENLIRGIKGSIDYYLDGKPSNAYDELNKAFDGSSIFSYLITQNTTLDSNFYRLRASEGNYSLQQGELFHIPFHKRVNVSTQRYSIPGFPCLYLANSIYVAWEELGRQPVEKLQAARLINKSDFKYLDLVTDIYTGRPEYVTKKTLDEKWHALLIWPLIAACSIKVFNRSAAFKPEYIIPQLLLQIVRNKGYLHGIRFSSTHIDLNTSLSTGDFHNYAVPVTKDKDMDYCDSLTKIFEITEVVPWQLLEVFSKANKGGATYGGTHPERTNIKSIELIRGRVLQYHFSPFGNLERVLDGLPTKPVITSPPA